jgi:hypothetical protein
MSRMESEMKRKIRYLQGKADWRAEEGRMSEPGQNRNEGW